MNLARIEDLVIDLDHLFAVEVDFRTSSPKLHLFLDLPDAPTSSGELKPSIFFSSSTRATVDAFFNRLGNKFIVGKESAESAGREWAVNADRISWAEYDKNAKSLKIGFSFGSSSSPRHLLIGPDAERLFQAIGSHI